MKYFCVECKNRHEITDIGIDLWNVCEKKLKESFNTTVNAIINRVGDRDRKISRFKDMINRHISEDGACRRSLRLKGSEIERHLENSSWDELQLSGTFTLKIRELVDSILASVKEESEEAKFLVPFCEDQDELLNTSLFKEDLICYFTNVGQERMFSYATDITGDPFTGSYTIKNNALDSAGAEDNDDGSLMEDDEGDEVGARTIELQRGYLRCCPHCGSVLSPAVGQAKEVVVGLFGSPRAGKTSCLAAVVSALRKEKYPGFSMKDFSNDLDWLELEPDVERYDLGRKVRKTPKEQIRVPSYSFLIKAGTNKRVLTMVDMPGEFWSSENGLNQEFHQQYIDLFRHIDCVWLFISKLSALEYPLGTDKKRNDRQRRLIQDFSEEENKTKTVPSILDMNLTKIREKMEAQGGKLPPFACIITKPEADADDLRDTVEYELFPVADVNDSNLKEYGAVITKLKTSKTGVYQCYLKEKMFFHKCKQIKEYLKAREKERLVRTLEENCTRRCYFSMAAYGHPAYDTDEASSAPTPYRELYPLLWTLAITGGMPIEHHEVAYKKKLFGGYDPNKTKRYTKNYTINFSNIPSMKHAEQEEQDIGKNLFMQKEVYTPTEYET